MKLCDGKYDFSVGLSGVLFCDRYREPWRDFVGDKAVHALYNHAVELERKLADIQTCFDRTGWLIPCRVDTLAEILGIHY